MPACRRLRRWVLAAAVLGSTLAYVDESVVNVALPRIESDLHATLAAMQWVINAYTLCMAALLLLGGAAADQLGRRFFFVIGVAVFALASIGCAAAANITMLILLRAIQGVGAALLIPCALALIGAAFEEKERGAAIGIWAGASAIASGAAPLLGGWLVDHASWRTIFLINPLLALPTLWIAVRRVPESRDAGSRPGLDWRGAVLAFLALGSLTYGLIASSELGWGNPAVIAALSVGGALLVGFLLAERLGSSPMVPLELFRSLRFGGVNLLTLLLYGALGVAFFFLPFLLVQARGYSATAAGAVYLPYTLVVGLLSRWSGRLVDNVGARAPLIVGPSLVALGFGVLAAGEGRYAITVVAMIVLGLGMAVTAAPLTTVVLNAVPADRTGIASGINNAVSTVGSLMLVAVLGSVAIGAYQRTLNEQLATRAVTPAVEEAVRSAQRGFVVPRLPAHVSAAERQQARSIIEGSMIITMRGVLWITALLALSSALTAALTLPPANRAVARGAAPSRVP